MKHFLLRTAGNWWIVVLTGLGIFVWAGYAAYQAKAAGAVRPAPAVSSFTANC